MNMMKYKCSLQTCPAIVLSLLYSVVLHMLLVVKDQVSGKLSFAAKKSFKIAKG
jgi:hypothetical protein